MHGRLKVKDKAEIEAEKKKKYQEKAARFKVGLDLCLKSKLKGDYNKDVMRVTWDLLCNNPDVYSIWNMRKEFLVNKKVEYEKLLKEFRSSKESEEIKSDKEVQLNCDQNCKESKENLKKNLEDNPEERIESKQQNTQIKKTAVPPIEELTNEFQKLCNDELELTEYALMKNSKSYSAWNHRLWILSLIPEPNFEREFKLNELYLQKDGRNLHCWYYRKNLCTISGRDLNDEVKFSLDKIKEDLGAFSYSTLVYRILVLTKASELGLIDFTKSWKDEYSMVEHALFTEPSDQALWFYLRWLLQIDFGRYLSLNHRSKEIVPIKVVFNKESKLLIFHLNRIVKEFPFNQVCLSVSDKIQVLKTDVKSVEHIPSKLWFVHLAIEENLDEIQLKGQMNQLNLRLKNLKNYCLWVNEKHHDKMDASKPQMKIQSEQLKSLLSLKELEPDNKWLNLILSYFEDTDQLQILSHLCKLDPLRTNYYEDQKSRIRLENQINNLGENETVVNLTRLQLTVLYTPEPFAHLNTLNLTENRLSCLTSNLNSLVSLKILVLDKNFIDKIQKMFALPNLEILSIQDNKLSKNSGIGHLTSCPNLKQLYLAGNKLTIDDLKELISKEINCYLEKV